MTNPTGKLNRVPAHACPRCGTTTTNHGRCTQCAQPETTRKNQRSSRGVYNTQRWRELRIRILQRDGFTCHKCGGKANHAGHITPFTNPTDPLAWNPANLHAECSHCNGREAGKRLQGGGAVASTGLRASPPTSTTTTTTVYAA
jgi:5-methylcytosine-specific restriction endonuclease McrA